MAERVPSGQEMGLVLVGIGVIQVGLAVAFLDGFLATFEMVLGVLLVLLGGGILVFVRRRNRRPD